MSHFTTIQTRMSDLGCIKSALGFLDFTYETGAATVKSYEGRVEPVELVIRTGTEYDIGFRKNEAEYEILADWWGVSRYAGLEEKLTVDKIRQRYAYEKVMKEQEVLKRQGFQLAKTEVTQDEVQVVTLRRY